MKDLVQLRIQDLVAKAKELEQTMQQSGVQLQQVSGAIQQCHWFLAEMEKKNASEEKQD
jgi:hypothetical protein